MLKLLRTNETKQATTATIAVWYAISNVFVKGIVFLTTPIFTRLLSKSQYGAFSNFTSWEGILAVIVTLDFTASIARAKYDYDERMDTYLSSILLCSNIVTIIAYIIVELNKDFFISWFNMDLLYIRAMFLYVLFLPAFTYLQSRHRIYRKYKFFVVFSISQAVVRTLFSVILVLFMQDKLLGRTIGNVIPLTIMNICLWLVIVKRGKRIDFRMVKYAAIISVPLIPHALSGILLGNSDRIMITHFCGPEATALYTLAYQVSLLANILWQSMNQAWAPWLYDNLHSNDRKAIWKNSKIYLSIFSILILGVYLLTPEVMYILGGKNYYEARFVMPPVVMGCVFQFVYGMYVNLEIYAKKTYIISIGTISAAALNIILNSIFIPKYGYIAAAYTTLVGYAALVAFHFINVRIFIRELYNIYDLKFIAVIIVLLFLAGGISLTMYNYNSIRYIVISVYLIAVLYGCCKYRLKLKRLFGLK